MKYLCVYIYILCVTKNKWLTTILITVIEIIENSNNLKISELTTRAVNINDLSAKKLFIQKTCMNGNARI